MHPAACMQEGKFEQAQALTAAAEEEARQAAAHAAAASQGAHAAEEAGAAAAAKREEQRRLEAQAAEAAEKVPKTRLLMQQCSGAGTSRTTEGGPAKYGWLMLRAWTCTGTNSQHGQEHMPRGRDRCFLQVYGFNECKTQERQTNLRFRSVQLGR